MGVKEIRMKPAAIITHGISVIRNGGQSKIEVIEAHHTMERSLQKSRRSPYNINSQTH
ncbi:hypothetical protein AAK706_13310 [Erysipelotrichaceae bacterium 66-17]